MGVFSWITQDTKRSISIHKPFKVVMSDNRGNKFIEENYNGYGIFGGKDFYQLAAEMNNIPGITGDVDNDRSLGINIYFSKNSSRYIFPNLNEDESLEWKNEKPDDCPNQGFFY